MPIKTQRNTFRSGGKTMPVETFQTAGPLAPTCGSSRRAWRGRPEHQHAVPPRRPQRGRRRLPKVHLVHYLDRTGERRASFSTMFQNFMPWMSTVQDGLAFASDQPGADPHRIGIVGISLGAALGLAVASTEHRSEGARDLFRAVAGGVRSLPRPSCRRL